MPRIAKGRNRWRLPGQLYGYVAPRNGVAVMFARGKKKSLGIEFVASNKEFALGELRKWLADSDGGSVGQPVMLFDAVSRYYRERISGAGPSTKGSWETVLITYFPVDMPLSLQLIVDRMVAAEREAITIRGRVSRVAKTRKTSTLTFYRQVIGRFFVWCVERKYMAESPVAYLPKLSRKTDAKLPARWTEEEVAAIVHWIQDKREPEVAAIVQFLAATGLRLVELERGEWAHCAEGVLTVLGKGTDRESVRLRHLPFAVNGAVQMPEVAAAIVALRAVSTGKKGLCGVPRRKIQYLFKVAANQLGLWWSRNTIDGREERRTIHSLRATAIYRLRHTYNLNADSINQLIGNSELVRRKHYDTAIEIADLVKHLSGQNVGKIDRPINQD